MKCSCPTCTNEATWVPTLLLYLPVRYLINTAIHVELSAFKCDSCKDHSDLASVLCDEMWQRFSEAIEKSKGVAPDRQRTQLAWTTVSQSQLIRVTATSDRTVIV